MDIKPRTDRDIGPEFKKPDAYVYVVVGDGKRAGTIKTIPFRKEFKSPLLTCEPTPRGIYTKVRRQFEERGWRLLDDCYDAEPDLKANINGEEIDGKECRRRFYAFQDAYRNGPQAGVKRKKLRKEYANAIVPGFPDELLPQYCRDLAHGRNPLAGVFDPVLGRIVDMTEESIPEAKPEAKAKSDKRQPRSNA